MFAWSAACHFKLRCKWWILSSDFQHRGLAVVPSLPPGLLLVTCSAVCCGGLGVLWNQGSSSVLPAFMLSTWPLGTFLFSLIHFSCYSSAVFTAVGVWDFSGTRDGGLLFLWSHWGHRLHYWVPFYPPHISCYWSSLLSAVRAWGFLEPGI